MKDILKKLEEFMVTPQLPPDATLKTDYVSELNKIVDEEESQYIYPKAGQNAPQQVQDAIKEFRGLPEAKRKNIPLLYWLLGDSTPAYKMTKEESEYTDESEREDQQCGNCKFAYKKLVNGKLICSQISGRIQENGYCRFWKD